MLETLARLFDFVARLVVAIVAAIVIFIAALIALVIVAVITGLILHGFTPQVSIYVPAILGCLAFVAVFGLGLECAAKKGFF